MNRLGIFVFFDKKGILDTYVEVMLKALAFWCTKLFVVVNGNILPESLKKLKSYTNDIVLRDNQGYDAGAYKDVFLKYLSCELIKQFDEIVLANDTFYGPLFPLDEIWNKMEQDDADFWGMTRHPKGVFEGDRPFESHIQGYFLVVKKRLLQDHVFWEFWEKLPYPKSYQMAVEEFEVKFTTYFENNGFRGRAWTDFFEPTYTVNDGENPYTFYSYELVKEMHVPFLKKKSLMFSVAGYVNTLNLLKDLERESDYEIKLIWDHIYRLSKERNFGERFNYYDLDKFYHEHNRVYIYGGGRLGKKIACYFQYKNWKFEGMIDSYDKNCQRLDDIMFDSNDGVIMALSEMYLMEVRNAVRKRLAEEQLLVPEFAK